MSKIFYADTSALVKLVASEQESDALRQWIRESDDLVLVSSDLVRTELMRAVRRTYPAHATRARDLIDSLLLVPISSDICESAARLEPVTLRSLDAIHLATALVLGDDLEAIVVYDDRLVDSARDYGLRTIAPA